VAGAAVAALGGKVLGTGDASPKARVALIKTTDRVKGVAEALKLISFPSPEGKDVFVKPNFNTSDPPPGSTHNETLRAVILEMKSRGASKISIGDRSGPEPTESVFEKKGIPGLAAETGAVLVDFEKLGDAGWIHLAPAGSHWRDGFDFALPLAESAYPVAVCCLKTHQYGGIHTMSLKLTVGAVHRRFMRELHGSADQRRMIAEINLGYRPKLIILDGLEAFIDGGPMTGTLAHPGVILAGTDRIAVDAVGLAILKTLGTTEAIMSKKIFEQEQLARAGELGLGIRRPDEIEIVAADDMESRVYAEILGNVLEKEKSR
jgi:uncharacterized protein (DUF362 family)